jgi:hypothetical protein
LTVPELTVPLPGDRVIVAVMVTYVGGEYSVRETVIAVAYCTTIAIPCASELLPAPSVAVTLIVYVPAVEGTVPLITPEVDTVKPEGKPLPAHVNGPLDVPSTAVSVTPEIAAPAVQPLKVDVDVMIGPIEAVKAVPEVPPCAVNPG